MKFSPSHFKFFSQTFQIVQDLPKFFTGHQNFGNFHNFACPNKSLPCYCASYSHGSQQLMISTEIIKNWGSRNNLGDICLPPPGATTDYIVSQLICYRVLLKRQGLGLACWPVLRLNLTLVAKIQSYLVKEKKINDLNIYSFIKSIASGHPILLSQGLMLKHKNVYQLNYIL